MRNREATVAAIRSSGGSVEAICFDVANGSEAARVLEPLAQAQPVQVIVNNAGCHADGALAGMEPLP
jgi:3-oxoacyl-[acyl-carrier protein] reductase